MGTTGTKRNSRKQQAQNAELELIIEEFARALRNANRSYIAKECSLLTPNMQQAWYKYVDFCVRHPQ